MLRTIAIALILVLSLGVMLPLANEAHGIRQSVQLHKRHRRHHSRAYLRHLYMAGEMTSGALNTLHNLSFYLDTMRRIREAIAFRTFDNFRQEFHRAVSPLPHDS